ncbi:family 2 encapsulin nanocompartment cargo protein terpene cyclase [Actinocorallia herbida]|uniref:family 2 encapsulin nanocompartment cargo protein terpene cyclase n=1 Tax=Actinocorallia herbida TaxID=58109 RepID=UPI0011CE3652|nr:family 2 encapsulin nanocompartment cargo protein terpene cyclase [Actinocorallia herbida]
MGQVSGEAAPQRVPWRMPGPTGLGTGAAAVHRTVGTPPVYTHRSWGDGSAPPLYVPAVERIDAALGAEVDARLRVWGAGLGFRDDELDAMAAAGFGRLAMLTHPDTDDPEALLTAAKLNAAWWAADDYYADDTSLGAVPELLPPRLALAMSAMDPPPFTGDFTPPLEEALADDLVLRMLRSATEHLAARGSAAQVQRVCYSTFAMFVSWSAYAAWRETDKRPPAWEYLSARQHDSFYTSMTLVDAVGGYEVPAELYYQERVRHALFQAGTASVMLNDLFSVAKDAADEKPVCNMVLLVAADRDCSVEAATEAVVELHNDLVRGFQAAHAELSAVPSPQLQWFLRGVRAWMGGGFEWHATNARYRTE